MDGESHALHNNNCTCCGLLSNSAKDGLCSDCHELQSSPTVTMVNAANQTDLMPSDASEDFKAQVENNDAATGSENTKTANDQQQNVENSSKSNSESVANVAENDFVATPKPHTEVVTKKNSPKHHKSSKIIKKKLKNCCLVCKKKIGLYAVQCRCGGLFCAFHRYSDRHDCKFDYRAWGAAEILRNNPRIVAAKIEKI